MTRPNRAGESYFEQVRSCWAKLPALEGCDKVLPAEIRESWARSVAYGLDPNILEEHVPPLSGSLQQNSIEKERNGNTFYLDTGDGYATLSVFKPPNDEEQTYSMSERWLGTNAVSLAFRLKRRVFVRGPEHFKKALHGRYCYAEPIFGPNQRINGVFCASSENYETTQQMSEFVHALASIGTSIYWMEVDTRARKSEITAILDQIPKGIVFVDRKNIIKYYNKKALTIFGLKSSGEDSVVFVRCVATMMDSVSTGQQSVTVNYRNNKKELYVMAVPVSENKFEKLILIEERDTSAPLPQFGRAETNFQDIHTKNPAMLKARQMVITAAAYDVPIMLIGKSGVGKELFAQAIHNASSRKGGPFVTLNVSTITPTLIESTLFGYEQGAFTGASQGGKYGYFEAASGGTLFLDELDSMPFDVQTKLLRALSSRRIRRVGGVEDISIDVRIISAGKTDMLKHGREHAFREDLYYRLSPVRIRVPSLAERREDIPLLAYEALEKAAQALSIPAPELTQEFLDCLCAYSWPGNVRELQNILSRALVFLAPGETKLTPELLPDYLTAEIHTASSAESDAPPDESMLKLAGVVAVCERLRRNGNDVEEVGRQLGVSVATVYNYIARGKRYGLLREEL